MNRVEVPVLAKKKLQRQTVLMMLDQLSEAHPYMSVGEIISSALNLQDIPRAMYYVSDMELISALAVYGKKSQE